MPRYKAILERSVSDDQRTDLWIIEDNEQDGIDVGSGRWMTEAEAKLFEWAANHISDGHIIQASERSGGHIDTYQGPTEELAAS